jgi:hypothetical protein
LTLAAICAFVFLTYRLVISPRVGSLSNSTSQALGGVEGWAREHGHVRFSRLSPTEGVWVADIQRGRLVFEGRATGEITNAHALEKRAIDNALAAYWNSPHH